MTVPIIRQSAGHGLMNTANAPFGCKFTPVRIFCFVSNQEITSNDAGDSTSWPKLN